MKKWGILLLLLSLQAQGQENLTLELEGGERIAYTLRQHAADAHLAQPGKELAPTSALDAAKLLNLHLSTGDIEEAALLSNAPRRRFEVLRDYRESVGAEEFKRVFAQYFVPENRVVGEIGIGRHRLLVWDLKSAGQLAGQFFVEVDGRFLMDDVPGEERNSLRRILEAYRTGKIVR
jgi:hypothetical protein